MVYCLDKCRTTEFRILNNSELTKELKQKYDEEDKMWKSGKQKNKEVKGHTD